MINQAVSPAPRREWSEIASADPDALLDHMPEWLDAIESAFPLRDASRLYRLNDGRRFVVPMVRRWSDPAPRFGFGTGRGIGGIVGADLDADVVSAILADLGDSRAVYTHIRPNPLHGPIWEAADTTRASTVDRRAHAIDLDGGADATWARFRKSGRKGVRKADQAGVEVSRHAGGELLDVYYGELYVRSVERWAERQREPLAMARFRANRRDPLPRLQAIARSLGSRFQLYLARVGGELAAGIVVLMGERNAHTTRGALHYELAGDTNATYAIEWAAIQDACAAGYRWYQMGESGQNRSLSEFKERFGATPFDYNEYRMERLPLLAIDRTARTAVKSLIGFRDT